MSVLDVCRFHLNVLVVGSIYLPRGIPILAIPETKFRRRRGGGNMMPLMTCTLVVSSRLIVSLISRILHFSSTTTPLHDSSNCLLGSPYCLLSNLDQRRPDPQPLKPLDCHGTAV